MSICDEFNTQTVTKRLPEQLRNLWKTMKRVCKKKLADEKVICNSVCSVDVSLFTACCWNVCLHCIITVEHHQ